MEQKILQYYKIVIQTIDRISGLIYMYTALAHYNPLASVSCPSRTRSRICLTNDLYVYMSI